MAVAASPAAEKAPGSSRREGDRQGQRGSAPGPEAAPAKLSEKVRLPLDVRLAVVAFGVVGFADMLLQIAWTKAIVLSIGNSTYAFSLIVSLFILGIAVGGAAAALLVDRWKNLLLALGICVFITAALVSATVPLLGFMPIIAARAFDRIQPPSYGKFLLTQILLVSATILPSTILMGTVFPIVGKMRTRAIDRIGSAIGSAYFWNTMGSILGTLAAGFLFIPLFGRVHATLYLGVGLSLVTGVVLIFKALHTSLPVRLAVVASLVAVVAIPAFLARIGEARYRLVIGPGQIDQGSTTELALQIFCTG